MLPSLTAVAGLSHGGFVGIVVGSPTASFYSCPPVCPGGTGCTPEISFSRSYNRYGCCAPGQVLCEGQCRPPCPGNQRMDRASCDCGCVGGDPGCLNGQVWDPVQCLCACPTDPCPDYRMTRDALCICQCPPGLTNCDGYCADITSDPLFCGACSAQPCDPFTEKCCPPGACTNICTDANCGDCGVAVGVGEKCCLSPNGYCTATTLGTNANCGDCGDVCTGGRTCQNGKCQCPSTSRTCVAGGDCCANTRDCCGQACCADGFTCCGNSASDCVDTYNDVKHCGDCNTTCASGEVCLNGICQCPQGTQKVGTCCCAPGYGCCGAAGHEVCTSLSSTPNCGSCGNTCKYEYIGTTTSVGNGSCDPTTQKCKCPTNWKSVGMSSGGEICCPSPYTRLCPNDPNHCCT